MPLPWQQLCRWSCFYYNQNSQISSCTSSTPNNLMGRVKTMWEPCLFRGRPPVPLKKVANGEIWFFTERDWSDNNIIGVILFLLEFIFPVSSLKIIAPIFLEIFLIQYFIVLLELLMTSSLSSYAKYKNVNISKTKEDIPKRKAPFYLTFWKAFQISSNYSLLHRHFKVLRSAHTKGLVAGTCRMDFSQGVASETSRLVCTLILHRNSSRRDHIFGPCDKSNELSWFDFWD